MENKVLDKDRLKQLFIAKDVKFGKNKSKAKYRTIWRT